jgi:hypothetical protein
MSNSKDEILNLERQFWQATDSRFYKDTMDEGAVIVMEPAGFLDKSTAVKMADSGQAGFTDVKIQDVKTLELTPDCVAIAYHGEGTSRQGKRQRSSVSSTYVRRNGTWKLAMTTHQPWQPKAES